MVVGPTEQVCSLGKRQSRRRRDVRGVSGGGGEGGGEGLAYGHMAAGVCPTENIPPRGYRDLALPFAQLRTASANLPGAAATGGRRWGFGGLWAGPTGMRLLRYLSPTPPLAAPLAPRGVCSSWFVREKASSVPRRSVWTGTAAAPPGQKGARGQGNIAPAEMFRSTSPRPLDRAHKHPPPWWPCPSDAPDRSAPVALRSPMCIASQPCNSALGSVGLRRFCDAERRRRPAADTST